MIPQKNGKQWAERALFYSIWAVLLIGFSLWRFRPSPEAAAEVPITLAPDVRPWFSEGVVQRTRGNALTVGLVPTPQYRRTLAKGPTEVTLRYRVSAPTGASSEGSTTVRFSPESSVGVALLNNPLREPASKIEFFLR